MAELPVLQEALHIILGFLEALDREDMDLLHERGEAARAFARQHIAMQTRWPAAQRLSDFLAQGEPLSG